MTMRMRTKFPALAIETLHYCAIFGTASQPIYFESGDGVSTTTLQHLRGGVVGGRDVLSTLTNVFDEEKEDSDAIAAIAKQTTTTTTRVQTFNLKENITLTLSSAVVDKDFCDPSSPLSLAGYMNGEIEV